MKRLGITAALALATVAEPAEGQRRRVNQAHTWVQLFGEQRVDPRWALSGEVQVRRADLAGETPQQFLVRWAVQRDVSPGVRLGAGHAFTHTSVYGEAPAASPFDEHRIYEQLQLAHRTAAVSWSHRFRAEQRWIEQTGAATGTWRFRQRVRAMTRASVDAPSLGVPVRRAYLTAWGELFAQVGATPDGQVFDQSRVALQGGWRVSPAVRFEAGYMQQLIQRGGSRVTENNHTLVLSVFANR